MPVKDSGTEQIIKDTAKRIFFGEGKLHATTQEIADAAGVSRTSLHYYFRSRDLLIETVFKESMQALSQRLDKVMVSDLPFREKTENLIEVFFKEAREYPYEETFLITEINTMGQQFIERISSRPIMDFLKEVAREMENGTIKRTNPIHFLINLFSLMSYPLIMAPIYQQFFHLTATDYDRIIAERKQVICQLIFG